MGQNNSGYYTVTEVARMLRVETVTIRRRVRNGDFPNVIKPGKSYLIPKSDVSTFLQLQYGRREV